MTKLEQLAKLMCPDVTLTINDLEERYKPRNLKEGARVTRFAPSPTGFMHIGNFQQAVTDYVVAKNKGGLFILRNEDTDKARENKDAVRVIMDILNEYNMTPDEYQYDGEIVGNYGPYIQSQRKEIYQALLNILLKLEEHILVFVVKISWMN